MKKKIVIVLVVLIVLSLFGTVQYFLNIQIENQLISPLLTVFSIFFGFYITSYAMFARSKYLSYLYEIQDKDDNRMTLLDILLRKFKIGTHALLYSMIYLIVLGILISNFGDSDLVKFLSYFLFGIIFLNFYNAFRAIDLFIKVVRQSAVKRE